MIRGEGSQTPGNHRAARAEGYAEPEAASQQQSASPAESGTSWRVWWSQFKSEFSVAGPTKQVSQIYYISGILAVMGSLVIGILTLGGDIFSGNSVLPHPKTGSTDSSIVTPKLSIAVLPFANLSGDPNHGYFADGLTCSLTTDVSRAVPGSFVVARDTAIEVQTCE